MVERARKKSWPEVLRWTLLAVAVTVLVAFLAEQHGQTADISYAKSPASTNPIPEGSAGELSGATVPSSDEMTSMLRASPVVRLPGAIATWDEARVREAIGTADIRILVAPPGIDDAASKRIYAVDNASIRVIGTQVTGGAIKVSTDGGPEWMRQFAVGDVTSQLLTIIANENHQAPPPDLSPLPRRDPTPAELVAVTASLGTSGRYLAPGTTLTDPPETTTAFPGKPLYVALPRQPPDRPLVHYGPALAREFPGRPIVVLYGGWAEYDGPSAAEFSDVATAGFYGQLGDRLSRYAYPQQAVLAAYLAQVTNVRYAGLFDRPLLYVPFDPLRVTLPALPWIFAACAVGFLALSIRPVARRSHPSASGVGIPARLAGLTALAVEVSGLTDGASDTALTRGIGELTAARAALDDKLPDRQVQKLLDAAESELDTVAELLGRADYRPATYLRGRLT